MKTTLIFLNLLVFSLSLPAQPAMQDRVDQLARQYIGDKHNRALVIGIISPEGVTYHTYGETEKGNRIKPDSSSVFEIGEVTSVFTTSLLSVMDAENLIDLNDPVQQYFPADVRIPVYTEIICEPLEQPNLYTEQGTHTMYYCFEDPSFHPEQMLLCDLATNTSGLPAYPTKKDKDPKAINPYSNYSLADLYGFISKYRTGYPTGLHYKFSPLGIAMLGNGLAWKSTMSYEALLQEKVLEPLHLKNTFLLPKDGRPAIILQGHDAKGNKIINSEYGALNPALGLYSNATDLAAFLSVLLHLSEVTIQQPLANTGNPRVAITDDKKLRGSYAGLGWTITPVEGNSKVVLTWQSGNTNGFASYIGYINEDSCGVVILSNSTNAIDELGREILLSIRATRLQTAPHSINH